MLSLTCTRYFFLLLFLFSVPGNHTQVSTFEPDDDFIWFGEKE